VTGINASHSHLFETDATDRVGHMSIRAQIATQAMAAMCAGSAWPDTRDGPEIARRAVAMADYLIFALNAPPQAIHERETHEPFR
jgi:hypothetical protein